MIGAVQTPGLASEGCGDEIVNGKFRLITIEEERAMQEALAAQYHDPSRDDPGDDLPLGYLPPEYTGNMGEWFQYFVPAVSPPVDGFPLIVCWHGYGVSCQSVAIDSYIDEECAARDWAFLAITGAYQCNYGCLEAQNNCTKAIQYLIEVMAVPVDTDRIYMAGFSMGGDGAASYASRHPKGCVDGFPVAGLILVAASYDWVHAYYQNDPGVQYWLPYLIGGEPPDYLFEYRQIGCVALTFGHTYIPDETMCQNLGTSMPVFVTYAGNDPLSYSVLQNEIFVQAITDAGANVYLDYKVTAPEPHSWQLLDVPEAFDFVEAYTLEDQDPTSLTRLVDRDTISFWADVKQETAGEFSMLRCDADSAANTLTVDEAYNTQSVNVDCTNLGLGSQSNLMVDYSSSSTASQTLLLESIPEPTYTVDTAGKLYRDATYDPVDQELSIIFQPAATELLKNSYEEYNLTLDTLEFAQLSQSVPYDLSGGEAFDAYLLMFSLDQIEFPIGMHHLLVYPFLPTFWLFSNLDFAGQASFNITVPYDPGLLGVKIYHQFVTYDNMLKEISNMVQTTIQI
jgi:acetyl esterase/lipase